MGGGRSATAGRNGAARGGGDTKQIPMGKLPDKLQGSGRAEVLIAAEDGKGNVQTVDPRELKNTQSEIGRDYVTTKQKMPVAAKVNGKLYVIDGHHRKYAAIESGKQIKVRVIDLDK